VIVVTTETIPGKKIVQVLGIVRGASVRAIPATGDLVAFMKNIVGGELEEYTKMGAEAREQAFDRMTTQAERLDANAIVCTRFTTCMIAAGANEMICYGTAVVVVDEKTGA
jgi:uncharacterized protein YbjQ (UPF0145 family)